jgi:very-short-patch-repair endonuclease
MTKAETFLWNEIKRKKILSIKFRRQFSIGAFVVDFYSPEIKLVIGVDGLTHLSEQEIEYDKHRQREIESFNIKFIRFTNPEIYHDLFNVLEKIKDKVSELKNAD